MNQFYCEISAIQQTPILCWVRFCRVLRAAQRANASRRPLDGRPKHMRVSSTDRTSPTRFFGLSKNCDGMRIALYVPFAFFVVAVLYCVCVRYVCALFSILLSLLSSSCVLYSRRRCARSLSV